VVSPVGPLQQEFRKRYGRTIVQCSDEYYVTAGARVPGAATYDGFVQYENGIGMVRTMLDDWARTRTRLRRSGERFDGRHIAIGCGTLAAPFLGEIGQELRDLTGVRVDVVPVTNSVFGERVNVSGLLCGSDYAEAFRDSQADMAVLPRASLDYFGRQFLDSMPVEELQERLGLPLRFASQWSEVVGILRGETGAVPTRAARPNGAFWSEEREQLPAGASWVSA
jgi:NifB/MoaA-like Fe-S oxidoreductase